ncbi:major facilitator superfamily [Heterobasidion irregulare TC 32-1]|uniref:Major facilitator superfamily n=1 Tax=Heterobasidion irregulare (strain TC 32-1) TaxID=747525 RepID=W4KMK5_HETIT|nr:major facilitator superfamily [Heterobasidion irregulare TC 32-1]ETW87073.1 major facilitator superfamily [Heterobasidion irregulare TC 32-1]
MTRDDRKVHRTPLPKMQLFLVILIMFAEPVSSTVIYPFVNAFVRETGITRGDEKKTGYYAGIIESLFFVGEAASVVQWGRASDRIGRKPVLMFGLVILSASMFSFGLSKTFWLLVTSRFIQGVANGNIGVTKSAMGELTDSTNMARAFGYIPLQWAAGATVGPLIGGLFSRPAERWPKLFGRSDFLRSYPYFMPCAVAGLLSLMLLTVVAMGLQETLPAAIKRQQQKISRQSSIYASETTTLLNHGDGSAYNNSQLPSESMIPDIPDSEESSPSIRSLLTPRLIILLINYTFLALVDQSHQVLLPLTYSTSIPLGGLGFDPFTIGAIMGTWGMINGITQSIIFAPLVEKLGARRLYVVAFACMLLVFPAYPLMSFLTKRAGGIVDAWVWTVLIMQLACNSMLFLCYGTMQLYLVDSAPSKSAYGTTNGIAQMTASLCRSVSPALASSLYAISLEHNLLGGSMVFCILWIITLAGVFASLHIPRAFTHPQ